MQKIFAHFINDTTGNVDRKLRQIRRGIEGIRGYFEHFWEPEIREAWQEGKPLNGGPIIEAPT